MADIDLEKWGDFDKKFSAAVATAKVKAARLEKLKDAVEVLVAAGRLTPDQGLVEGKVTKAVMGAYLTGRAFGESTSWKVGSKNKDEVDDAFLEYVHAVGGVHRAVAVAYQEVAEAAANRAREAAAAAAAPADTDGQTGAGPTGRTEGEVPREQPEQGRDGERRAQPLSETGANEQVTERGQGGQGTYHARDDADQENGGDDAVAPAAKRPRQAVDQDLVQRVKVRMNLSKKPTIPQMKLALPVEAHPPQKQWVDYAKAIENYTGTLNAPEAPAPTSNRQEEAAPAPDTLRAALREMR